MCTTLKRAPTPNLTKGRGSGVEVGVQESSRYDRSAFHRLSSSEVGSMLEDRILPTWMTKINRLTGAVVRSTK